MALQITNNQGIFEINGHLIGTNATSLRHHFDQLLTTTDYIIISIDGIQKIDTSGVQIITSLYKKAKKLNKVFQVIGKENKMIKRAFGIHNHIIRKEV